MAGGVHGPGGAAAPAYVDKGVGLATRFANAVGGHGGAPLAGHARNYMGTTYVEKPTFKKLLTEPAAFFKQSSMFKEQRVAKHRDRLLQELVRPTPNYDVVKSSLKNLVKVSSHHPFRFSPHVPDAGPQRAAMGSQWAILRQGIQSAKQQLPVRYHANLTKLDHSAALVEARIVAADALDARIQGFAGVGVGEVHDATKPKNYSGDGVGGAILIRSAQGGPLESVIKVDALSAMQSSVKIAGMLSHVATHADVELPFDFPMHSIVTPTQADKVKIRADLVGYKANFEQVRDNWTGPKNDQAYLLADQRPHAVKLRIDNLDAHGQVLKQTGLTGVTPSSRTTAEKIAMCNDPQFAQDMGMMTLLAPMFGLSDHAAIDQAGMCSLTNFIYNPTTGRLGVIDLSAREHGPVAARRIGTDPAPYVSRLLPGLLSELKTIAKTGTPTNIGARFTQSNSLGAGVATAMLTPGVIGMGDMFAANETAAVNDPTSGVNKNKFAANFMVGLVKAIDFMERNADVFVEAHTRMGNGWQPNEVADIANSMRALKPSERAAILKLAA